MRGLNILALPALASLLAAQAALAETPVEAAQRWGLIGTWRYNCGTPPDKIDYIQSYAVRNNRLYHDRNWGTGHDSSLVPSAVIRPDGTIDVTIVFGSLSQTRENLLRKTPDGGAIVLTSRSVDTNEYTIKDGKSVPSGGDIPPLTRCSVP
ncbi:MAG TPA: hypothetical protein VMI56_16290 [Reyranella sp.]|nr:hypothetical protein [Reyranella sp.]